MKSFTKRGLAFVMAMIMLLTSFGTVSFAAADKVSSSTKVTATEENTQTIDWKAVLISVIDFVKMVYHRIETEDYYSDDMDKSGVFGFLYEPKGVYFYTAADPWQRNVGYNEIFDIVAPTTLINFETKRLRFEYADKDWMIQMWKGQYGLLFYGAEVGVYTKPKERELVHYDAASDEDMLKMEMTFSYKRDGKWVKRFTRPYDSYWWCTGFLPGNLDGQFNTIKVDMRITAKNTAMLSKIRTALSANSISYAVKGLDVYFAY